MIFADPFGRRWGSEILQPVLVEGDVKSLTVRSLVSAVPWGTQKKPERQELWPGSLAPDKTRNMGSPREPAGSYGRSIIGGAGSTSPHTQSPLRALSF